VTAPWVDPRKSVSGGPRESRCLGLQRQVGGKFHPKLNTGERPIANKYREGKMKSTMSNGVKRAWNCWEGTHRRQWGGGFLILSSGGRWNSQTGWGELGGAQTLSAGCALRNFGELVRRLTRKGVPQVLKRTAPPPTKCRRSPRLETRTKESYLRASLWVIETRGRKETERGGNLVKKRHHRPINPPRRKIRVGARKQRPERWWTMPGEGEAKGNLGGGSPRF